MVSNRIVQNKWLAGSLRVIKLCVALLIMLNLFVVSAKAEDATAPSNEKISSEQLAELKNQIIVMQEIVAANKKSEANSSKDKNKIISNELARLQSLDKDGSKDNLTSTTLVDGPSLSQVSVSKYNTVSVHAQNVKISTILQELSVKSRKNIILAAGSDRVISMTFYSVPFYKALNTMLDVNGLAYVENNDFIEVFTKENMSKRIQGKNGMETKVFRLNYLRPKDALVAAEELLSNDGRVKTVEDDKDIVDESDSGKDESDRLNSDPVYKPNKQRFALNSALIVFDYKENIENIAQLLANLDRRPKQILLEATILEVTLNDTNEFGVNFSMLGSLKLSKFFEGGAGASEIDNSNVSGGFTTVGGLKAGVSVGDVSMLVNALDQITDVSVLSRPKVLSLDRQRARVLVGKNVGYFETSYQQDQIIQSIKFIESGISLDVRPYIVDGDKVRLKLSPRISNVTFRTVSDAKNNDQEIPDESVQTVAADIVVPVGSTAVIGGLFQESTTMNRTQIPGVGNIPIVGQVGRTQSDSVIRRELIFLIKPIILSDDKLENIGERELCNSKEMLAGMRNGLLPWSRLRQCRQLNLRAYRSILTGERDIGFWLYRRSLQLRNDQSEVCKNLGDLAEKEYCNKVDDQLYQSINELIIQGNSSNNSTWDNNGISVNSMGEVDNNNLVNNDDPMYPAGATDDRTLSEYRGISKSSDSTVKHIVNETDASKKQDSFFMPNDDAILEEDMFDDFDETFTGV